MKFKKSNDWDREKKIHRVVKGNSVDKHKKPIYNYEVDEDGLDYEFEEDLDEVDTLNTN